VVKTLDNNDYHIKSAMIQEYTKVLTYKKCMRTQLKLSVYNNRFIKLFYRNIEKLGR
jgi:hypothetical protein